MRIDTALTIPVLIFAWLSASAQAIKTVKGQEYMFAVFPAFPVLLTWPYDGAYLLVALWSALSERAVRRQSQFLSRVQDRRSSTVIRIGGTVGALGAIVVAVYCPQARAPAAVPLFWIGLALIVGSALIRQRCIRTLGRSFTSVVHVAPGQAVIESGPYRWVRHPAYTAGLVTYVGVGLALGNWASLALLLTMGLAVYAYRVRIEERVLLEVLGDAYRGYMRRTKRFIPWVL